MSPVLLSCIAANFDNGRISEFLDRAFSKSCHTDVARRRVLRNVYEFTSFLRSTAPDCPRNGPAIMISIVNFLDYSRRRGDSAPHAVRADFGMFCNVLGLDWSLTHPAVYVASLKSRLKMEKQAPLPPFEFVVALERAAANAKEDPGVRLYAAIFFLMTMASLRFCDLSDVQKLWKTKTAVCGISINHKDGGWALMNWATPRSGINTKGVWFQIIDQFWCKIKPKSEDEFAPLFPRVTPEWIIDRKRPGTSGTVQAALTRLEGRLGFPPLCTLHSPRNWFPTMGDQLLFPGEKRNRLGRWAKGSKMPEKYDRTFCVSELKIRDDILQELNKGWTPEDNFEIPTKKKEERDELETSPAGDTSVVTTPSDMRSEVDISKIYE